MVFAFGVTLKKTGVMRHKDAVLVARSEDQVVGDRQHLEAPLHALAVTSTRARERRHSEHAGQDETLLLPSVAFSLARNFEVALSLRRSCGRQPVSQVVAIRSQSDTGLARASIR